MSLNLVLDGVAAAATLTLRYTSVLFVRFHPIGPRYLQTIYGSATLFALTWLTQAFLGKRYRARGRRNAASVVLLGWPDVSRPALSALSLLANVLCLAAAVDFVYRGHMLYQSEDLSFSRVGYVDTSSARIVIRAHGLAAVEVHLKSDSESSWTHRETIGISQEADFVGNIHLDNLVSGTTYSYKTNASHVGTFQTAAENAKNWTLVSTSCISPFYPYNPTDHALRVKGLEHLGRFAATRAIDFVLFLGDFIYIDLPYPLGWSRAHYTAAYRKTYASPSWSPALRSLPWLHVYDDHEIINDWSSNETGLYKDALHPYWHYQGHANPPSRFGAGQTYHTFQRGDVAFFVLDTRRYRSDSSLEDGPGKTMLGEGQLAHLKDWLETERAWKVVVSSVPFTRNWRGSDAVDSWAGYIWERDHVLDMMKLTDGVVILSGDRHEHATTIFPASVEAKGSKDIIEFSTSALNQFYEPFARNHRQIEDTDIAVHNHYKGNSKFAAITFDTSDPHQWRTHFDLIVDGEKAWEYDWKYER